jgi:predicted DNA-binding transcriptional regulator AlpA
MVAKFFPEAAPERQTPPALLTMSLIRRHYVPAGGRTLQRWVSAGRFPKPDIAFGGKVRYWKRETVERWIAAQTAAGEH